MATLRLIAALLLLTTTASAVDVSTEEELKAAAASGADITLLNNIMLEGGGNVVLATDTSATIDGNGFKVDGQGRTRCFWIEVTVYIKDLTVANCLTGEPGSGLSENWGGAFVVDGLPNAARVYMSAVTIRSSGAFLGGGMAILSGARVAATNTAFISNSANAGGGGAIFLLEATMVCSGCKFQGSIGDYGKDVTISNCARTNEGQDCAVETRSSFEASPCDAGSYGTKGAALHVEDAANVLAGATVYSHSCSYCPPGKASTVPAGVDVASGCVNCESPSYTDGEPELVAGVYQGNHQE